MSLVLRLILFPVILIVVPCITRTVLLECPVLAGALIGVGVALVGVAGLLLLAHDSYEYFISAP